MSRHLKPEEWLNLINKYNNNISVTEIFKEYMVLTNNYSQKYFRKRSFRQEFIKRVVLYNNGMKYALTHKKDPSLMKKRGRPPKNKQNNSDEDLINELSIEQLKDVARRYLQIIREKQKKSNIKESKHFKKWPISKISRFLKISRQTIYKSRVKKYGAKFVAKSKANNYEFEIRELRKIHKHAGREKLAKLLENTYKIALNSRTLGRFLSKNNLNSTIRKKRKCREIKDTKFMGIDLVKRDYNDISNLNIKSTDVSYLPATSDATQNHVYLSIIIDHKTKILESFNLSLSNDLDLVINNINKNDFKNKEFIIHSDHGFQYTNNLFIEKIEELNGKTSYSRVGNSLDNRESEYWFSILKTELIRHLAISKMTLKDLEEKIKDFVNYYNNQRIQSNLNWKTPQQYAMML